MRISHLLVLLLHQFYLLIKIKIVHYSDLPSINMKREQTSGKNTCKKNWTTWRGIKKSLKSLKFSLWYWYILRYWELWNHDIYSYYKVKFKYFFFTQYLYLYLNTFSHTVFCNILNSLPCIYAHLCLSFCLFFWQ